MTVSFEHKKWYVTCTEDCGENEGGYFCQVYDINDEVKGDGEGLDEFCIHPEELLEDESNLELLVKGYIHFFFDKEKEGNNNRENKECAEVITSLVGYKKWSELVNSQITLKKKIEMQKCN